MTAVLPLRSARSVFVGVGRTFSAEPIAKYRKSENITVGTETVQNNLRKLESVSLISKRRYASRAKAYSKLSGNPAWPARFSVTAYQAVVGAKGITPLQLNRIMRL